MLIVFNSIFHSNLKSWKVCALCAVLNKKHVASDNSIFSYYSTVHSLKIALLPELRRRRVPPRSWRIIWCKTQLEHLEGYQRNNYKYINLSQLKQFYNVHGWVFALRFFVRIAGFWKKERIALLRVTEQFTLFLNIKLKPKSQVFKRSKVHS